jgi:hypothetical protein
MTDDRSLLQPPQGASLPASAVERTNLLVHYYRAEMARMTSWRDRIDRTSTCTGRRTADIAAYCPITSAISLPGRASRSSCSMVHWRGALSGRQRRSLVPWRKRSPVTWS